MIGVPSLPVFYVCGLVVAAAAMSYLVLAIWRVIRFRAVCDTGLAFQPAVTVLKPPCGLEPRLYECLRSFCMLDYAPLQIIFGVGDPADPAIALVRRLIEEFPARDLSLVIDCAVHDMNLKMTGFSPPLWSMPACAMSPTASGRSPPYGAMRSRRSAASAC